jgi:hypothetical protein
MSAQPGSAGTQTPPNFLEESLISFSGERRRGIDFLPKNSYLSRGIFPKSRVRAVVGENGQLQNEALLCEEDLRPIDVYAFYRKEIIP